VSYPARAIPVEGPADSERLWARSVDSRRLHWSDDRGATWSSRDTSLGRDDNVTVTLAGEWVAFTTNTRIEFSSDLGETWAVRDLGAALSAFRITDVRWQITSSGNLLGAVGSVGRAERLIRSTDPSWTSFERSDITTSVGLVYVEVAGPFSYVLDDQRWQVSEDDGRTWVTRDPFAELR
jgi:hypothetical protein